MKFATIILLLTATACGSDTFLSFPPDAGGDSEAATDGSAAPDSTPDSNPLTDGGTCTPPGMWTWKCANGTQNVSAPGVYCTNWAGRLTTPAACTTCKENYSCACLEGHDAAYCPPDSGTWHCDDKDSQLLVTCQ